MLECESVQVVTRVPKTTKAEMEAAVESAKSAYKSWSNTSPLTRQQIMFKFQNIIKANMVSEAELVSRPFIRCII